MPNIDPLDLPPSQEPAAPGSVVDLHGVFRMIMDKAWLIVTCIILAVVAAAVYVQRAQRVYEATNTVQVEQHEAKIVKADEVVSEDTRELDALNTIAQKLCNPSLLQEVLDANHLLPAAGETKLVNGKALTRDEVMLNYERNIKSTLRRNTRLIDTTVRDPDKQLAAKLANELVEDYLLQDAKVQTNTEVRAYKFLEEEAERQKKKLAASEQLLQDYREKNHSISLQSNQDILTPALQDLNKRLTEAKAALVQADGAYQDIKLMSTNIEEVLAYSQVATDPEVVQIATDVAKHENEFVVIRQTYGPEHPKYIDAKKSVDALKEQLAQTVLKVRKRIQESIHIAYVNALTSERGLEQQFTQTETNSMQLSQTAVQFKVLARDVESDTASLDGIMARLRETGVQEQITPERIRLIERAFPPELPASPRPKLAFALAILGGLALGLVASFVLETANTTFRTVDEAESYLQLPVLGAVPKMPKNKIQISKLVALEDRNSPGAEVFRTLRTTLSMLGREQDRRTYLFTSSLPSEGKTFTSVNYAVSLSQQGLRTLLIDMDLRRPMLEEFFTGKRSVLPGVTDYFLGRKKFEELCLQHKEVPKLSWIPGGSSVPNPLELLTQSDFMQLMGEALAQFDRVVIDTAPLLPVSDTLLLASKVQTVVLVVQGRRTARKAVERSVQLLNKANAPIGGIVLNLLPNRKLGGYYYSYYHGYGYGTYGRKEAEKTPANV
jgi:polysaccharide biosynthesis transport protein